jgi:hypothetical protein
MKKLLNLVLVVALLLVGIVPVFAAGNGKITITNAENGKTYKIYEILYLESYNTEKGAYAYKATNTWKSFVESETGKKYFVTDAQGYVTWVKDANVTKLAEDAINYAKANANIITADASQTATADGALVFENLGLGYYLVDSTMGALCGLTTTKPEAQIIEKNTPPTIKKEVKEDSTSTYGESNTAQVGDVIEFRTAIYAKKGAENYKLIDNMTDGLTLDQNSIEVKVGEKVLVKNTDYTLETTEHGFTITFTKSYLDTITEDTTIVVTYKATLNDKAVVGKVEGEYGKGNDNKTILEYGDNHKTEYDETRTYTFSFDLVKTDSNKIQLEGAEFILLDTDKNKIPVVKVAGKDNTYRIALDGETGVNIVAGHVTIEGLDVDTYYLREVKQPDGYNKLANDIEVKMTANNNPATTESEEVVKEGVTTITITYVDGGIQVINTTGAVLPSTGGFGTFMFILMGTLTVLACGILLTAKLRMSKISA